MIVNVIDRLLEKKHISRTHLQLVGVLLVCDAFGGYSLVKMTIDLLQVGVAATLIATKYEEIWPHMV